MSNRKPEALSETELANRLGQMNRQAIGHLSDEVSTDQDDNLERYFGMKYGDEEDGRSQAISMDVAEVVDWAIPDILEPFLAGDKAVEFIPSARGEEEYCERATDLVNHVFYVENDGATFLHDIVKTGAIQKIAFSKTVTEEEEEEEKTTLSGLSIAHLQELQQDKSITIDEVTAEPLIEELADQDALAAFSDGQVYKVSLTRIEKEVCTKLYAVAPEQIKFSPRATCLEKIPYICHEQEVTRSDLYEMGFDEDKIATIPTSGKGHDQQRDEIRFHDESRRDNDHIQYATETVLLCEEYPLIDANGDGRVERLQVFRVGNVILKKEEVDDHPFDCWSPDRIPNRLVGLAIADKVKQTAYIKTHLTRQLLDNVYLANNPRIEVPDEAMTEDTIADLLTYRVGGLIRTKGAGQMMRPIEIPDRSATALQAILYMDGVREQQSGVTKNGMAVNSEVVDPKSATESRRQDRNEQVRKRLMIRMLAQTFLVPVFRKILKNTVRYQAAAKDIMIRGKWVAVDPREWNAELKCRVSVGLGYANRDEMIQGATLIGQSQAEGQQFGLVVQPKHMFKTLGKLVEATGLGFPEDYAVDPDSPEGQQIMQQMQENSQQQDPKMVEAQGKLQLKQQESQVSQQMKQMELEHKVQMAQVQAEADFKIAQMKAQMEFALGRAQLQAETELSREQMDAEQELATWEARQNVDIKREQVKKMARPSGSNGSSSVRFGGKVG